MQNRRHFLKSSLFVSGGAALAISTPSLAATNSLPNGIVYSTEKTGKWAGKEKGHVPTITVKGNQVTVQTFHPMSAEHYIVKHTLVTEDGEVLGEHLFASTDKAAISTYTVETKNKTLFATSFCNQHDFWVSKATKI
ncbi:desulfoferrodoxin family protein [Shewanella intestini]|uniref:Desulfoferrodoxin n=1 Tax=Shewanella intestini TaxID=2017544 RepID=A0ABS5I330_9GAMM|nr:MULTISPECIES: desulfoferrodoxin family protein [Shewanella]MBR9728442.1 desulfoferrodoxin [Shewanella intestini]MRG36784.1 desulfoferrodoxin [Shewanella sp. XMDDZSB0408]